MNAYEPRGAKLGVANEHTPQPLQVASDPYVARAGCSPIGQQIQTVLTDLLQHIGLGTPLVVVSGVPGTGKTWLLDKTFKLRSEKGFSARREDRGDLIDVVLADTCDILLVDEADSAAPELLEQLMAAHSSRRKRGTIVLMCLPGSVMRFDRVGRYPPLLQLLPVSDDEAQEFLESGAMSIGHNALFTREAARLVIAQSGGSPRLLRRNASFAYFAAAAEGQIRISAEHVAQALEATNFASGQKDPNQGKSWTKPDPNDHSALYQKGPAQQPPSSETSRQAACAASSLSADAATDVSAPVPSKSTPIETAAESKPASRKLSKFALYGTPAAGLRVFTETLRADKDEMELEKTKRREANRIFYHSWRFGK